VAKARSSQ